MSLRAALLLGALLLPGCLDYKITVEVSVLPDGTARRVIRIREGSKPPRTWERFRPPAQPFALVGSESEGFTARATLPPGRHPSGIAVNLERYEGTYQGARELPAAEGEARVEVSDLLIGTLYSYRETIALGTDDARFRSEFRRWLATDLRILIAALEIAMPDVEFAAVGQRAREKLLVRAEYSVVAIRQALVGLMRDHRDQRYGGDLSVWLENPHVELILSELEVLGLRRKPGAPAARSLQAFVSDGFWEVRGGLVDEFLAPLSPEQRARVRETVASKTFKEVLKQGAAKLFPDKVERDRLEVEHGRVALFGVGAYFVHGLLDDFDLRVRLRMPGRILWTNGGLGARPEVEWRLTNADLFAAAPRLAAHSFAPSAGLEDGEWHLTPLLKLRDKLVSVDAEGRKALAEMLKADGPVDEDAVKARHGEAVAAAWTALEAARS